MITRQNPQFNSPWLLMLLFFVATSMCHAQNTKIKPYAPELFPSDISGGICGFSPNGKIIYFVREDTLQDKLFIYQAEKSGKKWINEGLLPFSGTHNDMGGRLTPDGSTFYFTSDRSGGSNIADDQWNIWYAVLTNGNWSEAQPIDAINNLGKECCPTPIDNTTILFSSDQGEGKEWWFYSWDGNKETLLSDLTVKEAWQWPSSFHPTQKLLFFNSMKRKDSHGKDDIYISSYKNGQWTPPVHPGAPINTSFYEDGAILSPNGKLLIFNRHETWATPSKVICIKWKPLRKGLGI